ncbi:MAG: hypothetical protein MUE97_00660 [Phycisphaerales bacterium]|jgi:hypothetical protein|nr:hypothetical protein [Phycisphaerales bacterium]
MAKHQNLTKHQQGIVNRYYAQHDAIHVTKLMELVSELAVSEGKKAAGLWKRVELALRQCGIEEAKIRAVVDGADVKKLAELVGRLSK